MLRIFLEFNVVSDLKTLYVLRETVGFTPLRIAIQNQK